MHMMISPEEWLSENAMYCNRQGLRVTPAHCEEYRKIHAESRCRGCGGLEERRRDLEYKEPVVFFSDPEPEAVMTTALAEALQEILDCDMVAGNQAGSEMSAFQRELLSLLEDDPEELIVERRPKSKVSRRYARFMGRCPKCRGYMVNSPERHDDDVYRCFTCGHRTSPEYQWNRQQGG